MLGIRSTLQSEEQKKDLEYIQKGIVENKGHRRA